MRVYILFLGIIFLFASCQDTQDETKEMEFPPIEVDYPETRMGTVVDTYHGTDIADPYRWLEIHTAAEVEEWTPFHYENNMST